MHGAQIYIYIFVQNIAYRARAVMDVSVVRITSSLQELQTTIRPELLRGVPLDASRTMGVWK